MHVTHDKKCAKFPPKFSVPSAFEEITGSSPETESSDTTGHGSGYNFTTTSKAI